jgi:hypothetical protein
MDWDDLFDDERYDEEELRNSSTQLQDNVKLTTEKAQNILVALGRDELSAFARIYVNKNDPLYELSKSIKPIEGFEDFMIHGQPNLVEHETTNGQWLQYSAQDFADFLLEDRNEYHGGNIRLLSCKSGMFDDGFAQQLANIMGVKVMAPTQTLWVNKDGEMFIADSEVLADLWDNGENVRQTGAWKVFAPQKEGE